MAYSLIRISDILGRTLVEVPVSQGQPFTIAAMPTMPGQIILIWFISELYKYPTIKVFKTGNSIRASIRTTKAKRKSTTFSSDNYHLFIHSYTWKDFEIQCRGIKSGEHLSVRVYTTI